jgi:hypothetical protein
MERSSMRPCTPFVGVAVCGHIVSFPLFLHHDLLILTDPFKNHIGSSIAKAPHYFYNVDRKIEGLDFKKWDIPFLSCSHVNSLQYYRLINCNAKYLLTVHFVYDKTCLTGHHSSFPLPPHF